MLVSFHEPNGNTDRTGFNACLAIVASANVTKIVCLCQLENAGTMNMKKQLTAAVTVLVL
jgi:hypothetical protein